MGGPLLGKDFECVQRIFALAGEWQAGIHVLTRIASRGSGGGSGEAVTCDGGDSAGKVAWWRTIVVDGFFPTAGYSILLKFLDSG